MFSLKFCLRADQSLEFSVSRISWTVESSKNSSIDWAPAVRAAHSRASTTNNRTPYFAAPWAFIAVSLPSSAAAATCGPADLPATSRIETAGRAAPERRPIGPRAPQRILDRLAHGVERDPPEPIQIPVAAERQRPIPIGMMLAARGFVNSGSPPVPALPNRISSIRATTSNAPAPGSEGRAARRRPPSLHR